MNLNIFYTMNSKSALNYYREGLNAPQSHRQALLVQFCRAAISERERGEMELYQVGSKVVTLIGSMDPPLPDSLDDLLGVASELDMAGQGGTSAEADETVWANFKSLVADIKVASR